MSPTNALLDFERSTRLPFNALSFSLSSSLRSQTLPNHHIPLRPGWQSVPRLTTVLLGGALCFPRSGIPPSLVYVFACKYPGSSRDNGILYKRPFPVNSADFVNPSAAPSPSRLFSWWLGARFRSESIRWTRKTGVGASASREEPCERGLANSGRAALAERAWRVKGVKRELRRP